jgi:hypothetical protein
MNLQDIVNTMNAKGYVIYTQPNRLNVVGIRSGNDTSVYYDDYIAFFYYDSNGNIQGKICAATTDPSVNYLVNPMSGSGTAILKAGQYLDTYTIGLHKGKYLALVQQLKPVTVIRDTDRNSLLNFFASTETGFYGINIHKSSSGKADYLVIDDDSAGCQVFQNIADFNEMMALAQVSKLKYGNVFTYTLIDEKDTIKNTRNTVVLGVGLLLMGVFGYLYYKKFKRGA